MSSIITHLCLDDGNPVEWVVFPEVSTAILRMKTAAAAAELRRRARQLDVKDGPSVETPPIRSKQICIWGLSAHEYSPDFATDVKTELEEFGTIRSLRYPKRNKPVLLVEFEKEESCASAIAVKHGQVMLGRTVYLHHV